MQNRKLLVLFLFYSCPQEGHVKILTVRLTLTARIRILSQDACYWNRHWGQVGSKVVDSLQIMNTIKLSLFNLRKGFELLAFCQLILEY